MLFILILTAVAITYAVISNLLIPRLNATTSLVSPLATLSGSDVLSVNKTNNTQALETIIKKSLTGNESSFGIIIKNLKSDEGYYLNEHLVFESASLYKLWIMATTYKQIQTGKLAENEPLNQTIRILNQKFGIDEEFAELTEGSITLTVNDALNQMITISHNYASLLLTEKIKLSNVVTFLNEHGLTESAVGTAGDSPTTTAYDTALFLEKLYQGEFADKEHTDKMILLLQNQRLNNKLPKYLPENTKIAHKTGELGLFTHDAGIIYTPKGDYIIVILSKSEDPSTAEEQISQISKAVYNRITHE